MAIPRRTVFAVCVILASCATLCRAADTLCSFIVGQDDDDEYDLIDNTTVRCNEETDYCYSFWLADPNGDKTKFSMQKQGCWNNPISKCTGEVCIANSESTNGGHNNTRFCCCHGNMCNVNVTDNYTEIPPEMDQTLQKIIPLDPGYRQKTIIIALASVCSVAIVIALSYLAIRLYMGSRKQPPDPLYLVEGPSTPCFELDQLKLVSVINSGRYGEVWKGTLGDIDVAVKVFTSSQRQYYLNERDIYMLPHMDHDALLHFYGGEERLTVDGVTQYLLVMSYAQLGTLSGYLKNNSVDWTTLCKMCYSIASGLAHLHNDITKYDKTKPAIAHRDVNSHNILVNDNLTCSLCDYGFAMKISGSRFYRGGQEENAEQASLTDVGTLRYMAPEVLEGAVNLRDCEASLKQIDVYALGLVIWELSTRCCDLYQGLPVPDYQLPFQADVGLRPSFQEMQNHVSRNKKRPAFPDIWKDTNQVIRALKETIEDCWDQDAEARLTSLCVEERILDMTALWENRHKGITPTMLSSGLGDLEDKANIQRNLTSSQNLPSQSADGTVPEHAHDINLNMAAEALHMSEPVNELTGNMSRRQQRCSYTDTSMSAASTVETTVSPMDPEDPIVGPPTKANCNLHAARTSLRPHQGQNPTVERNTHKRSDEELTIMGNSLVSKSQAAAANTTPRQDNVGHARRQANGPRRTDNAHLTDEMLDAIADNLESSLVQNDMLGHQQQHHPPITYHQNHVSAGEPLIVRPKQPNVPGNGFAHAQDAKPKTWFSKFKKSKANVDPNKAGSSSGGGKLSFPFFGRFGSHKDDTSAGASGGNKPQNVTGNTLGESDYLLERRRREDEQYEASKSNLAAASNQLPSLRPPSPQSQVDTEVCFMNGNAIVRPTSLPLGSRQTNLNTNSNNIASQAPAATLVANEMTVSGSENDSVFMENEPPEAAQSAIRAPDNRLLASNEESNSAKAQTTRETAANDNQDVNHNQPITRDYSPPSVSDKTVMANGYIGRKHQNTAPDVNLANGHNKLSHVTNGPIPINLRHELLKNNVAKPLNCHVRKKLSPEDSNVKARHSWYGDNRDSKINRDNAAGVLKESPKAHSSISLQQFASSESMTNKLESLQANDFRC